MNHAVEIEQLRNIPNSINGHLMNIVVEDTISALRSLTSSGKLDLQIYHGPKGICYPPLFNIETDPDQDKNLQQADTIELFNKGKSYLLETREGNINSDQMRQDELLEMYDELMGILEDKEDPEWEYTINDGKIALLPQS